MKIAGIIASALLVVTLSACGSLPKKTETRIDQAPIVTLQGVPAGAIIWIDGEPIGTAAGGDETFELRKGQREVEIVLNGQSIYKRSLFVQDGTTRVVDIAEKY